MKEKRLVKKAVYHVIVFVIGIIMIYPLIWMVMSSFKENSTIFSTAGSLIPENLYSAIIPRDGRLWKDFLCHVLPKLHLHLSGGHSGNRGILRLVAYGFARFKFRGRGILFAAMLLSMMLPAQVLMIPQYLWYQKLGWWGPTCR